MKKNKDFIDAKVVRVELIFGGTPEIETCLFASVTIETEDGKQWELWSKYRSDYIQADPEKK